LQAWRALTRLAAPGLILLAEAIVSPEKVIKYLGRGVATNRECELAYHNVLMVMLWSSLAEREVRLMTKTLTHISAIPTGSAWLTYVRCHDDIGWAVTEEDAAAVGLNGFAHRAFLSDFYSGIFPGTFARGATFQYNPRTGDRRISGAGASLAGLERALELEDPREIDLALRRILLLHGIVLAFGGIPVLYMGDELALLNDYAFIDEPEHADDNRWLHRPVMDWSTAARRHDETAPAGIVFQGLQHLIQRRKALPQFHAQAATQPVWAHNDHVFALIRQSPRGRVLVLGNFSEQPQRVPAYRLQELEFERVLVDCLTDRPVDPRDGILLEPYEQLWLEEHTAP
jgi:amylosucrase